MNPYADLDELREKELEKAERIHELFEEEWSIEKANCEAAHYPEGLIGTIEDCLRHSAEVWLKLRGRI